MKNKVVLWSFIFVLSNAPSNLHAASQQTNIQKAAAILAYAKKESARMEGSVDTTNKLIHQLLKKRLPKEQPAESAATQDEAEARTLENAIEQMETIRNSYSRLNPYRYIISNKISYLKKLQEKTIEEAGTEEYQQEVQKALANLTSWLK